MAKVLTDKEINFTQLGIELGRVPVHAVAGVFVESDAVSQAALESAVEAHVFDPDYVDPEYVPTPDPRVTAREKAQAVQAGPIRDALLAILDAV